MCYSLQCYQTIEGKFEEKSFLNVANKNKTFYPSLSSFVARLVQGNGDQLLLWGTMALVMWAVLFSADEPLWNNNKQQLTCCFALNNGNNQSHLRDKMFVYFHHCSFVLYSEVWPAELKDIWNFFYHFSKFLVNIHKKIWLHWR